MKPVPVTAFSTADAVVGRSNAPWGEMPAPLESSRMPIAPAWRASTVRTEMANFRIVADLMLKPWPKYAPTPVFSSTLAVAAKVFSSVVAAPNLNAGDFTAAVFRRPLIAAT